MSIRVLEAIIKRTWLPVHHELDLTIGDFLVPPLSLELFLSRSHLKDAALRQQCVVGSIWPHPCLNPVKSSPQTFKILAGKCADLPILAKTSLISESPCFFKLPPTNLEWPAPSLRLSSPSMYGDQCWLSPREPPCPRDRMQAKITSRRGPLGTIGSPTVSSPFTGPPEIDTRWKSRWCLWLVSEPDVLQYRATLRSFPAPSVASKVMKGVLYSCILEISHLSDTRFSDIFSQSAVSLFHFLRVSFEAQIFFNFHKVQFTNSLFYLLCFCVILNSLYSAQGIKILPLFFLCLSVLSLIFQSMIHC